jgi:hypothetical protein
MKCSHCEAPLLLSGSRCEYRRRPIERPTLVTQAKARPPKTKPKWSFRGIEGLIGAGFISNYSLSDDLDAASRIFD